MPGGDWDDPMKPPGAIKRPQMMDQEEKQIDFDPNGCNRCSDFDEDCFGLDHLHCWLYDPTKGLCPFLPDPTKE